MTAIKVCQMRCISCKTWFNSPIQFGDSESFNSATMERNSTNCPKCGSIVPCNKENMRWVQSDGKGGFVGIDTGG